MAFIYVNSIHDGYQAVMSYFLDSYRVKTRNGVETMDYGYMTLKFEDPGRGMLWYETPNMHRIAAKRALGVMTGSALRDDTMPSRIIDVVNRLYADPTTLDAVITVETLEDKRPGSPMAATPSIMGIRFTIEPKDRQTLDCDIVMSKSDVLLDLPLDLFAVWQLQCTVAHAMGVVGGQLTASVWNLYSPGISGYHMDRLQAVADPRNLMDAGTFFQPSGLPHSNIRISLLTAQELLAGRYPELMASVADRHDDDSEKWFYDNTRKLPTHLVPSVGTRSHGNVRPISVRQSEGRSGNH